MPGGNVLRVSRGSQVNVSGGRVVLSNTAKETLANTGRAGYNPDDIEQRKTVVSIQLYQNNGEVNKCQNY